jgi:hypothetical protein
MDHFSMEIYAPTGSNLNGNQHFTEQIDVLVDWTSIITAAVVEEAALVPFRSAALLSNFSENAN